MPSKRPPWVLVPATPTPSPSVVKKNAGSQSSLLQSIEDILDQTITPSLPYDIVVVRAVLPGWSTRNFPSLSSSPSRLATANSLLPSSSPLKDDDEEEDGEELWMEKSEQPECRSLLKELISVKLSSPSLSTNVGIIWREGTNAASGIQPSLMHDVIEISDSEDERPLVRKQLMPSMEDIIDISDLEDDRAGSPIQVSVATA
ncbi:hypothetical protein A0H81_10631 [Grifola frondosa]|uniref:Uncharacterized protein n=1 Tax=Grifola frondosa TaxID=5627 RepID=A0A1C7LYS3_GRIFR|nr:hypothetical protein A0H81_10631 [Grifola frondosa]